GRDRRRRGGARGPDRQVAARALRLDGELRRDARVLPVRDAGGEGVAPRVPLRRLRGGRRRVRRGGSGDPEEPRRARPVARRLHRRPLPVQGAHRRPARASARRRLVILVLVALALAWAAPARAAGPFTYVGATKCRLCHGTDRVGNQYHLWTESKHASAFET